MREKKIRRPGVDTENEGAKRERERGANKKEKQFETVRKTSRCAYLFANGDVIRPNQRTLNITARYADFEGTLPSCLSRRILPR